MLIPPSVTFAVTAVFATQAYADFCPYSRFNIGRSAVTVHIWQTFPNWQCNVQYLKNKMSS